MGEIDLYVVVRISLVERGPGRPALCCVRPCHGVVPEHGRPISRRALVACCHPGARDVGHDHARGPSGVRRSHRGSKPGVARKALAINVDFDVQLSS
jgi:hypothetical protein